MARLLVVDPVAERRSRTCASIEGAGHTAVGAVSVAQALERMADEQFELVLAPCGGDEAVARRLGLLLAERPEAPRMVWVVPRAAEPPTAGAAWVRAPVQVPALLGLLGRLGMDEVQGWSGADFLKAVDGPATVFPPLQVLYLAHRVKATGGVRIAGEGSEVVVHVRNGRLVGVEGLPGIFSPDKPTGASDLSGQIMAGIQAGQGAETLMGAAAAGIVAALLRMPAGTCQAVEWDGLAQLPGPPIQLPSTIPRAIADGLQAVRGVGQVRRHLGRMRRNTVQVRYPRDCPEPQLGLSAVALRLLREGARVESFGELLGTGKRGENDPTWLAADLLAHLGLLSFGPGPKKGSEFAPQALDGPDGALEEEDTEEVLSDDPRHATLLEARNRLVAASPWEVLDITQSKQCEPDAVAHSFRMISATYHPDRFGGADEAVRELAKDCFTRVAEAYHAIQEPGVLNDLGLRLAAQEKGKHYVSDREQVSARIMFKRGELFMKRKEWAAAAKILADAKSVDPNAWRYRFAWIEASWHGEQLAPEDVVDELKQVLKMEGVDRASVLYLSGDVSLRAGHDAQALRYFRQTLEADPEHVGAKRRVWLHERRSKDQAPEEESSGLSALSGFFRRKGGKSEG